ncbi:MAG: hypothetical protein RBS57_09750 [Desulforhabdus sp.]|jgi:hypothetical protein|nr:hypothetical protein [Desulforhabdus sp.]
MRFDEAVPGFEEMLKFPLIDALLGRRSRRFLLGAEIPQGELAFASRCEPVPLSDLEKLLVLTATAGNTGWHNMIMHNARYAPHLPNYAASAGGRTFPSAAGFHTSEIFFTDDEGVYFFQTRDAPALAEKRESGLLDLAGLLDAHSNHVLKLAEGRLHLPPADPHIEGHNTWVVNRPGSLLIIPVADVAQHNIANLCYYLQNGFCIYDDLHGNPIEGLERFRHLYDPDNLLPLSFMESYSLMEATTEISTACYAGMLMLQAMGLGGWMFNGMSPYSMLGASGDPNVPGLGFRYDTDTHWPLPNPTGLAGVFEGFCPPHFADMGAAVEAFAQRKFGSEGPFHPSTPGPWKESAKVRGSAQIHSEEFKACVTLQAQYILDRFGKFPGTVSTMLAFTYLQAHHLDLEFYDRYFKPGAYLETHKRHMECWHPEFKR